MCDVVRSRFLLFVDGDIYWTGNSVRLYGLEGHSYGTLDKKSDYVRVTEAYTDQYYGNAAAAEGAAAWCQRIAVSAWQTHG